MNDEIKEILKIDKQLLDKIENILGTELSNEEYDIFYNYFNEIRKPNILIDIKGVESIKDYITNLQKENERLNNQYDLMENSLDEKQEVIDKAIEYISHEWFKREQIGISELSFSYTELQHILDILRGEDNE